MKDSPHAARGTPVQERNVADLVLESLLSRPHQLAICEPGGRSVTCLGLHGRILAYARHLTHCGLGRDDRLLVQVPNGIELAASVLGAMLVGATPVLCEPGLGPAVYRDRVRAANPSWLLVTPLVESACASTFHLWFRGSLGSKEFSSCGSHGSVSCGARAHAYHGIGSRGSLLVTP
jgi:acyl-CoA synthetase (AMP-forming)/AMP-acid ligase II